MKLQQVYNATREQQEVQQEYSKSTASLYDIVILLILLINTEYKKSLEIKFQACLHFFFFFF